MPTLAAAIGSGSETFGAMAVEPGPESSPVDAVVVAAVPGEEWLSDRPLAMRRPAQ